MFRCKLSSHSLLRPLPQTTLSLLALQSSQSMPLKRKNRLLSEQVNGKLSMRQLSKNTSCFIKKVFSHSYISINVFVHHCLDQRSRRRRVTDAMSEVSLTREQADSLFVLQGE